MSTKHTPGPWDIYPTFQNSADAIFDWITPIWSRTDGVCVGSVSQAGARGSEEAVANARLVAAAPDLLAACQLAASFGNLPKAAREMIRDAIAKATGQ